MVCLLFDYLHFLTIDRLDFRQFSISCEEAENITVVNYHFVHFIACEFRTSVLY